MIRLSGLRLNLLLGARLSIRGPSKSWNPSNLIRPFSASFPRFNEAVIEPTTEATPLKPAKRASSKFKNERIVMWKLYAQFARHNTHLSLVAVVEDLDFLLKNDSLSYNDKVLYYLQLPHHPKIHISAGQLGFRKSNRQEYEAAYQVATKMFKTIQDRNLVGHGDKVELILRDFGKGRPPFLAALEGKEGASLRPYIVRVSDSTPLRFGGCRPKKLRRL